MTLSGVRNSAGERCQELALQSTGVLGVGSGGAFAAGDEKLLEVQRPAILTRIGDLIVRGNLGQLAPNLRAGGVEVLWERSNTQRTVTVRMAESPVTPVTAVMEGGVTTPE